MDWTAQIDGYCERTDFTFWSEPLNALTNLLYIFGGLWMYWRSRHYSLPIATALSVLLVLIGIGSFLFHTYATSWAALADVAPIGAFILVYIFAVHRDVLGLKAWIAAVATAGFVPFAAVMVPLLNQIPFLRISNFYWTVPILLVAYALIVRRYKAETAMGMIAGALLLSVSITLRSLDELLCDVFPVGTHIFWHTLNSIMLPFMIEVYRRHMLEAREASG